MIRFVRALPIAAALLAGGSVPALAQGEFVVIDFQDPPPFKMKWDGGERELIIVGKPGAKGPGAFWNFAHVANGGWNNRGFMRFSWWDWDVSKIGHGSDQAGFTANASAFRPKSGWPGVGPYYLRFRMRINKPIMPHEPNGQCDSDTQMKFFMWNNFAGRGTDRMIMMLHAGSESGGRDASQTTIDVRAGVSGSFARAQIPNAQWAHVQIAWQWGPEGTAFQRIYVNTNTVDRPSAENRRFTDLDFGEGRTWGPRSGPTGLDGQFFLGDITNTGSCVSEDAEIDLMDVEIANTFDPKWFPGS